jgi:ribosome maturation factor RimP
MSENSRRGTRGGHPGSAQPPTQPPDQRRLVSLLEPVVLAMGMDLEGVKVALAGRRRLLRIVVDADGGVGLDEIAEVSREISARLDARDAMGDAPYTLEVSSPGVDRPLTEPRHWRRATGRLVAVPVGTDHLSLQGRVVGADDAGVSFEIDGVRRTFGYGELGPGRIQVEFGRLDEADAEDRDGY